ncbi:MAG: hypothetical protein ACR2QO_19555 [Acidimicrobiales bacterium]
MTASDNPGSRKVSPRIPEELTKRRSAKPSTRQQTSGPSPTRIVAAAASASVGLGLMTVMASTGQPDIVVEVQPTPIVVESTGNAGQQPEIRVVGAATPAPEAAAPGAAQSSTEGS